MKLSHTHWALILLAICILLILLGRFVFFAS